MITGPVGAGKSTVAGTVTDMLGDDGFVNAWIDMDFLRQVHPRSAGDPYGKELGYRNLAAIWPNLRDAGIRCALIADVVEDRSQSLESYLRAMPGSAPIIVRLDVPMSLVFDRLERRERTEDSLAWSKARAPELQAIMERGNVEDILIDVGDRAPHDIAREIIWRCKLVPRVKEGSSPGESNRFPVDHS